MKRMAMMLISLCVICITLVSCGLQGVRGRVVQIEPDGTYVVKELGGSHRRVRVDEKTHKNEVKVGDRVQAFVDETGRAQFLERLDD